MAYNRQQQAPQQSDAEMESMAEAELSRLKRQYRIMENDRVAYAEDAKVQLRNQQNMIERMEYEKSELALAIKNAKSSLNVRKDEAMERKLKCLLKRRSEYAEMIKKEKQQIGELEEQIVKVSSVFDFHGLCSGISDILRCSKCFT